MCSVVSHTPEHPGKHRKFDDFGPAITEHVQKKEILEHLYSYQEKDSVKIYDLYSERIKLERGTPAEFNQVFYDYYSRIRTNSNTDYGVCRDCIDKFGFFEKRSYQKILDSFNH